MSENSGRSGYSETKAPVSGARSRKLRLLGLIAMVLVNAAVLYFTARSDFSKKGEPLEFSLLSQRSLMSLLGAFGCVFLALGAESVKYLFMMKRLKQRVSLKAAFESAALGRYYDCITPFGTGGQPFQIWFLHTQGYSGGSASAMPLAEYITKQSGMILLGLLVAVFSGIGDSVGIRIAAYAGLLVYALVPSMVVISAVSPAASARIVGFFVNLGAKLHLVKHPEATLSKAENALTRYSNSLKRLAGSRSLIAILLGLSLVYQLSMCSLPYFVLRVFGGSPAYFTALCRCVFVYASTNLVPTPGNAGAAEGSFYILFDQAEGSGLFWAMLVWRFFSYYLFIIIGMVIYASRAIKSALKRH